jgi:hypothetical protein
MLTTLSSEPQVVDHVDTPIDRSEVVRYLGYPRGTQPSRAIDEALDRWVDVAAQRATPRATYCIFPVAALDRRWVRLQTSRGITEFHGAIGEYLGPIEWVAAFIATAGPGVEAFASEMLRSGDAVAGLVINAVGSERAEAAEAAAINELREYLTHTNFDLTLPYSPGYCGMKITEQTNLFGLFGDHTVGVTLSPDCLMKPIKSISGLIGIGPSDEVMSWGSPCDRCEVKHCNMRR